MSYTLNCTYYTFIHFFKYSKSRFTDIIFEDLWEDTLNDIKAAHFISVLADSSSDSSVRELEGVYVQILHKGIPRNIFTCVEELTNATALGHYTSIKNGEYM